MISNQLAPIDSRFSPWLTPLVYPLACNVVLPFYFGHIEVTGREHLPLDGPVILAPTHRSRWDALMVGYAAGRWVTARDLRFMVSANEVSGVQGWFIRRLGGFPVDPLQPAIASLRHGVEILQAGEMLVIFPEGAIFRDDTVHPLKPGLARLALQAEALTPGLNVKIVPISLHYGEPNVSWRCGVKVRIGAPIAVKDYALSTPKENARLLTADLQKSLKGLNEGKATVIAPPKAVSMPTQTYALSQSEY